MTDTLGAPVSGIGVSFSASDGSYLSHRLVATDAGGIAQWQGYVHGTGRQQIEVGTPGSPSVTFTLNVSPSSHPYDGSYACSYGDGGADEFLIQSGALARLYPNAPPFMEYTFSEADGTLDYVSRISLNNRNRFHGQVVLDSQQRAIANGVMHFFTPGLAWIYPAISARCLRD